jgi:hypothetical protein
MTLVAPMAYRAVGGLPVIIHPWATVDLAKLAPGGRLPLGSMRERSSPAGCRMTA